jgi:hypothetical protein
MMPRYSLSLLDRQHVAHWLQHPTERKSDECLHRRDQLVPVQQIADAFLTLLEFLAAAARAWITFISVRETLMVSSDQNL